MAQYIPKTAQPIATTVMRTINACAASRLECAGGARSTMGDGSLGAVAASMASRDVSLRLTWGAEKGEREWAEVGMVRFPQLDVSWCC